MNGLSSIFSSSSNPEDPEVAKFTEMFIKNSHELINLLSKTNEFIEYPIDQKVMVLLSGGIIFAGPLLCDKFATRAIPLHREIRARDVKYFCQVAPALFPEVKVEHIEKIIALIEGDSVPPETLGDIFYEIERLLDISIERQRALGEKAAVGWKLLQEARASRASQIKTDARGD